MSTTILLVDDHAPFRRALRTLLDDDLGLEVVGEAADGTTAIRLALELEPDVVVMDVRMPPPNGLETTRKILAARPDTAVLALSMHAHSAYVDAMLAAGASGYVVKGGTAAEIRAAVHTVAAGKTLPRPDAA